MFNSLVFCLVLRNVTFIINTINQLILVMGMQYFFEVGSTFLNIIMMCGNCKIYSFRDTIYPEVVSLYLF